MLAVGFSLVIGLFSSKIYLYKVGDAAQKEEL